MSDPSTSAAAATMSNPASSSASSSHALAPLHPYAGYETHYAPPYPSHGGIPFQQQQNPGAAQRSQADAEYELMKRSFANISLAASGAGGGSSSSNNSNNNMMPAGAGQATLSSSTASDNFSAPLHNGTGGGGGANGGGLDSPSFDPSKRSRYSTVPAAQFSNHPLHFGQMPTLLPGYSLGHPPDTVGSVPVSRHDSGPSALANEYNQYYAGMAAVAAAGAGSAIPNVMGGSLFLPPSLASIAAAGALPMVQQASHASSSSSGGSSIAPPHHNMPHTYASIAAPSSTDSRSLHDHQHQQHQRTVSAMPNLASGLGAPQQLLQHQHQQQQQQHATGSIPSPNQYGGGMVGPASFPPSANNSASSAFSSSHASPFPSINNPPLVQSTQASPLSNTSSGLVMQQQQQHQQALLNAAAALAAATQQQAQQQSQPAGASAGPAMSPMAPALAQSLSAMSAHSGHDPAAMFPPLFQQQQQQQQQQQGIGSPPAFPPQGPFNPALAAAAGLGVPGLFGPGPFGLAGMGGLSMSLPLGAPNLSQPMGETDPAGQGGSQIRTIYVGNLPGDASVDELLSQVRYGPIESVKILPDKSCAFISFLDPNTAAAFHSDANLRKIQLHGLDLKIGWGKPNTIPAPVLQAVQQYGATRNVYLGNLDESYTEQSLRDELSKYGHLDQVKIVRDKNIGFVHFLSIANAIKVVQELPKDPAWHGRRVNYGKDRCAYVPRNQHQQQQHNQMAAAMAAQAASQLTGNLLSGFGSPFAQSLSPAMQPLSPTFSPLGFQGPFVDPALANGNRTIYLGNMHPDTTCEDVCNTIRGGILQEVRHIPDKHICFITFVLPESALALHQFASQQGITIKNRRLKVGWGKHSGPCPPGIAAIVNSGGSRNVYIGNIDDFETFTLDKIKEDLSEFGEIEQVNALEEKSCAFVNFTKISSAVKAIEALKVHEEYSKFKIAYGKDRVGNLARAPFMRRGSSHLSGSQSQHHHQQGQHYSPPPHLSHSVGPSSPNGYMSPSMAAVLSNSSSLALGSDEDVRQPSGGSNTASHSPPDDIRVGNSSNDLVVQQPPPQQTTRASTPQTDAAANAAAAVSSAERKQNQLAQHDRQP